MFDGADVVASAIGASEIIVYLHGPRDQVRERIGAALKEREAAGQRARASAFAETTTHFLSGGPSAVASFLEGASAFSGDPAVPVTHTSGRPSIVSTAATYAHVGLIARLGPSWFRTAGTAKMPGSTLVTIAGAVRGSGTVVEVLQSVTFAELLGESVGLEDSLRALLLGGYSGAWVNGASAWNFLVDWNALRELGAPTGSGLIAVLDYQACGLAETVRILEWMAGESAGDCEICSDGLCALMEPLQLLCQGKAHTRDVTRLHQLVAATRKTGACGHPNGAIELVNSALATFADEVTWHLRGHKCAAARVGLPLRSNLEWHGSLVTNPVLYNHDDQSVTSALGK